MRARPRQVPLEIIQQPEMWSQTDFRENILLRLIRGKNEPMIFYDVESEGQDRDPAVVNFVELGVKEGIFAFQELPDGLGYNLTEKGLEKAQELLLIYSL